MNPGRQERRSHHLRRTLPVAQPRCNKPRATAKVGGRVWGSGVIWTSAGKGSNTVLDFQQILAVYKSRPKRTASSKEACGHMQMSTKS